MKGADRLSGGELRELIVSRFRKKGIDHELIEIKISKGSRVILRGEAASETERRFMVRTAEEVVGPGYVIDEIEVLTDLYDDDDAGETIDGFGHDDEVLDEDNECAGTEDVFRSVEEGLPYIPPMRSSFGEPPQNGIRRRGTRGRR